MAQADLQGNVNVSKYGDKMTGAGGFINISQYARKVIFLGTFSAGGLNVIIGDGRLTINRQGISKKFVRTEVEHITFSGRYAAKRGQKVVCVTERCVFSLTANGLELIEIAPGIDLKRGILEMMDFTPIINSEPGLMDRRIFLPDTMGLTLSG